MQCGTRQAGLKGGKARPEKRGWGREGKTARPGPRGQVREARSARAGLRGQAHPSSAPTRAPHLNLRRHGENVKEGAHVNQGLLHFAVNRAKKVEGHGQLEEQPIDHDKVAHANLALRVGVRKVGVRGRIMDHARTHHLSAAPF